MLRQLWRHEHPQCGSTLRILAPRSPRGGRGYSGAVCDDCHEQFYDDTTAVMLTCCAATAFRRNTRGRFGRTGVLVPRPAVATGYGMNRRRRCDGRRAAVGSCLPVSFLPCRNSTTSSCRRAARLCCSNSSAPTDGTELTDPQARRTEAEWRDALAVRTSLDEPQQRTLVYLAVNMPLPSATLPGERPERH